MANEDATPLQQRLGALESLESEIIQKGATRVTKGGSIFHGHFYVIGILKRTLSQSSGFRQLIEAKNFQCAAGILRMQIDSAMRIHALALVDDPDAFCRAWFDGTPVDQLKARDGQRLRDKYLREKLAEKHPWVDPVYRDASNFIHFSARHFFTSIVSTDDETRVMNFAITGSDPPKPDEEYFEIIDAFFEATKLIGILAISYLYVLAGEIPGEEPA
jgi:hypothetical protein